MAKFCQSCMMPLNKDPNHGGTEADGSKSQKYCSLCYRDGAFLWPDATAKDMQALVVEKLTEKGKPRLLTWFFTRSIPKLERWRNSAS